MGAKSQIWRWISQFQSGEKMHKKFNIPGFPELRWHQAAPDSIRQHQLASLRSVFQDSPYSDVESDNTTGLGLIDMRIRTNCPLHYEFIEHDEQSELFVISTVIKK